jgi:regulator of replication initiation timing
MALAGKAAQRDGWGYQTEHLALTHTAVGVAAVVQQARWRQASNPLDHHAPDAEPDRDPNQRDSTATNRPEFERRTTQETLIARNNTLTALRVAAKKRIAELESELGAAREELVRRDNENRSLQTSLDLIASENARLGARLAENVAAVDQGRSDVERTKAALAAAEAERDTLASAIDEAKRTRDAEAAALNPYLDVMSSRAAAAERLLEDTRQSLAAKTAENSSLVHENSRLSRCFAEGDAAVEAAYSQHEHMKTLLSAAIAERDKLTTAFANANESRQTEVDNLKSRLAAMSSRVVTAETLFAGARQSLLEKLEWLQDTLRAKICQVNELRQSHAKLIEDTRILLKSVDARDRSLADANWKIRLLAELVAEPRAVAHQQVEVRRTDMLLAGTVAF